jgi:hypothetical protein
MIKISCPHCGQGYDCDDEFNGETITCQKCSKKFEISNKKPVHTPESKEQQKNIEHQPQQAIQEQNFSTKCPFCLSEIPFGAKRCRHCGTWISGMALTDRIFSIIIKILFASFIIAIIAFFASAITVAVIQAIFDK